MAAISAGWAGGGAELAVLEQTWRNHSDRFVAAVDDDIRVRTKPGASESTRTPQGPSSIARVLVAASSPALALS